MTARSGHTRSGHTRSGHTRSGHTSLGRHLRLTLLVAGVAVGASACQLSVGGEPRPAASAAAATASPSADGTAPATDLPAAADPAGRELPSDADRRGSIPTAVDQGGPAGDPAVVPAVSPQAPATAPTATLPPTTAPTATLPPTTAPTTTAPTTTAPTTTAPTTTAPTTTAPTTTAPPTTQPPTTQPPLTAPPYTVPPLSFVTYQVDVSAVSLSLAAECLPAGRSSLTVTGERYVTGHTFEPFSVAVGTGTTTLGTASSMTTDTVGQGFAGYTTWTVEGYQQREADFAIARVGSTQVRDHRSITSLDGTRSCQAEVVYTVTVTAL